MIETSRTDAPQCLKENYKEWGIEYKRNLDANPNYQHHWHSRRDEIDDALFLMTKNHSLRASGATIEHFRPKNGKDKFPLLAYYWGNLFYCCSNCQKKGTRFSRKLLKPDQATYSFRHYFIYNYSTGIIDPNPARSLEDQERAKITINWYGLNKWGRPDERVKERNCFLEDKELGKNKITNDYSYRFILH